MAKKGERTICKHCGVKIHFTGEFWIHKHAMSHLAAPETKSIAKLLKPSVRVIDPNNEDW